MVAVGGVGDVDVSSENNPLFRNLIRRYAAMLSCGGIRTLGPGLGSRLPGELALL